MVRPGKLRDSDADRAAAIKYLSDSGLIPILSEWNFHSSPLLDKQLWRWILSLGS